MALEPTIYPGEFLPIVDKRERAVVTGNLGVVVYSYIMVPFIFT